MISPHSPKYTVFAKLWYFLQTYILTVNRFDLFLQGSLLVIVLLETNAYLLLRRDARTGRLPAMIEEWLFIGCGVAEFVFGPGLGWFHKGRRQFALSGWLLITSAAGLLVLAFPYAEPNPPAVELCGGDLITAYTEPLSSEPNANARRVILIITAILCSLTRISIWAHGVTYLDDHEPAHGPYFYGILITIRLSLGMSGENWLGGSSVSDDWWKAHLSLCMLVFMFSVLFTFFKTKLPQWKEIYVTDDTEGPSVTWEKIEKLPEGAVIDYNSLPTPTTENVHHFLDKLVVVKLNGGLGTSMGCKGPKSVIQVRNDLTFLDLTVQQIE
ncbi:uncharacterized protein LOC113238977, partial [Hyposmocoma kahamanoa]|uniref:uncharacterized protein LOC113238977 n=1 Tax=Hyposmocoma kahamanoa TaxID=1477025 RepID=UPI000E6D94E8